MATAKAAELAARNARQQLEDCGLFMRAAHRDTFQRRIDTFTAATEARIREQIAAEIGAYDGPAPWDLQSAAGGHWIDSRDGALAARIARGEQR